MTNRGASMKEKNKILLLVVYQSSINLNNCMYNKK